jgi:hypothetical protein
MADEHNQRSVHRFFCQHFTSQEPFGKHDLQAVTDWTDTSFRTYWSKQFRPLLVEVGVEIFRVSEFFRRFVRWEEFQKHVTQVRGADAYRPLTYDNVLVFEFFMPLTNEGPLRQSLDALFYKDTIRRRLHTLGVARLNERIQREVGETDEAYLERVGLWISERISGYSISHVSGRFRGYDLMCLDEAAKVAADGGRYLIDETTAIVRFIFRCGKPRERAASRRRDLFSVFDEEKADPDEQTKKEAGIVRWLFGALFVQSIVEAIGGEDEIWMVESGMVNRLHIWRVEG